MRRLNELVLSRIHGTMQAEGEVVELRSGGEALVEPRSFDEPSSASESARCAGR